MGFVRTRGGVVGRHVRGGRRSLCRRERSRDIRIGPGMLAFCGCAGGWVGGTDKLADDGLGIAVVEV